MAEQIKNNKYKLIIRAKKFNPIISSNDVPKLRASYYLIGACLARYQMCTIKLPGGCNFVDRPIDVHLKAFEELGYECNISKNVLYIKKSKKESKTITLTKLSVGASINTLFACANLNIQINNISQEPEVIETIYFLKKLGVKLTVNKSKIYIHSFNINTNIEYQIIGDRIETGSYMLLASVIPNSNLIIKGAPIKYIDNIIKVVKELGSDVEIKEDYIIVKGKNIKSLNIEINEYPSFPTDLQPILSVVLLNGNADSTIKDNIYPNRISHIDELVKMNGIIKCENNNILLSKSHLVGQHVVAKDLRLAFALVVASCIAQDYTFIHNAELLLRGYEKPIIKLKKIGVNISEYIC